MLILDIPYSRKLSREKTFTNFAFIFFWLSKKVFSTNFGAWCPLTWRRWAIHASFLYKNRIFHQFAKVFSLESPRYMVDVECFLSLSHRSQHGVWHDEGNVHQHASHDCDRGLDQLDLLRVHHQWVAMATQPLVWLSSSSTFLPLSGTPTHASTCAFCFSLPPRAFFIMPSPTHTTTLIYVHSQGSLPPDTEVQGHVAARNWTEDAQCFMVRPSPVSEGSGSYIFLHSYLPRKTLSFSGRSLQLRLYLHLIIRACQYVKIVCEVPFSSF